MDNPVRPITIKMNIIGILFDIVIILLYARCLNINN